MLGDVFNNILDRPMRNSNYFAAILKIKILFQKYTANELFYAGIDPNEMRLDRVGCFDVGVQCGGWGHIDLELKMEDRK